LESRGLRSPSGQAGQSWVWGRTLTGLSPPSSSSAWPRPRLPPNTSSASTGNRCRGATPRADLRQAGAGRLSCCHHPPPPAQSQPVPSLTSIHMPLWLQGLLCQTGEKGLGDRAFVPDSPGPGGTDLPPPSRVTLKGSHLSQVNESVSTHSNYC
jgi:hypothetical protein